MNYSNLMVMENITAYLYNLILDGKGKPLTTEKVFLAM